MRTFARAITPRLLAALDRYSGRDAGRSPAGREEHARAEPGRWTVSGPLPQPRRSADPQCRSPRPRRLDRERRRSADHRRDPARSRAAPADQGRDRPRSPPRALHPHRVRAGDAAAEGLGVARRAHRGSHAVAVLPSRDRGRPRTDHRAAARGVLATGPHPPRAPERASSSASCAAAFRRRWHGAKTIAARSGSPPISL